MSAFAQMPLAEVCTIVGGGTPRRSNKAYFNGNIPWATPTDVTTLDSLFIKRTKEAITETGLKESSARLVPAGTVLMTSRATIGYTAVATQPMATNQGFANLVCGERILPEYLAYWLRNQREFLIQLAGGTTFKELSKSTLKKVVLPLPSLNEQRRIVVILNRAAKIERLRTQAQERLREFIPALFIKMFGDPVENPMGWKLQQFGEVVEEFRYGTSKKCSIESTDGTLPILRIPNILHGNIDWNKTKFTALDDRQANVIRLKVGDILFVRTNGNPELIGRCAVFRSDRDTGFASYLIRARMLTDAPVLPEYAADTLSSTALRKIILGLARTTAGNYNVNIANLASLSIPIPPLDRQHQYTELVEATRSTLVVAKTGSRMISQLSSSLMSRLLGEGT